MRHDTALRMTASTEADGLLQANLRYLVNEWDPIGVADVVDGEYDCVLASLWAQLTCGTTRAALSEHLWFWVEDHLGLDPVLCGTGAFADALLARAATWDPAAGDHARRGGPARWADAT